MTVDIRKINERQKYQIWRKINKVTLMQIAQAINIHYSNVSRWENGKIDLPKCVIEKYNNFIKEFEERKKIEHAKV